MDLKSIDRLFEDIEELSEDEKYYKLKLIYYRQNINRIREGISDMHKELDKMKEDLAQEENRLADAVNKMSIIANNSAEDNVNETLKNMSVEDLFLTYYMQDLFTPEEIVYFVNNKIKKSDVACLCHYDIMQLYLAADNLAYQFNEDKEEEFINLVYSGLKKKVEEKHSNNIVYRIDNEISRVRNKRYLTKTFQDGIVNKLEALKLLYQLK